MSVKGLLLDVAIHPSALMRELKTAADVDAEVQRIRDALNALYPDRITDGGVTVEVEKVIGEEE